MIGKTLLVLAWFPLTLGLLTINLFLLAATARASSNASVPSQIVNQTGRNVTASAGTAQILGANIVAGDARGLLLANFLQNHSSPMTPYADLIVSEADKNGLDFRLVVAIAMCESNLGKRMPTSDSFNPFGIAVYTGQLNGKKFTGWEHAISWISQYLRQRFYDRGITDLKGIAATYAPPSVENGYSWSNCVEQFMGTIL